MAGFPTLLDSKYVGATPLLNIFPSYPTDAMPRLSTGYFGTMGIVELIGVSLLKPSSRKIRSKVNEIEPLASSIRGKGVLQPLIVRPLNGGFEIVAGHRRYEACVKLGLDQVPCIVKYLDDREAYEVALTENLQRQTLDPVEEAEAFKRYVLEFGWGSVTELARRIGKSEEYVSHRILLLQLPHMVLDKVSQRELSPSAARELVWLKDREKQKDLAAAVLEYGLNVRRIRKVASLARAGIGVETAVKIVLKHEDSLSLAPTQASRENYDEWKRVLEKTILILRLTMLRLDSVVEEIRDKELREFIVKKRFTIHQLTDSCVHSLKKEHSQPGEQEDYTTPPEEESYTLSP